MPNRPAALTADRKARQALVNAMLKERARAEKAEAERDEARALVAALVGAPSVLDNPHATPIYRDGARVGWRCNRCYTETWLDANLTPCEPDCPVGQARKALAAWAGEDG